MQITALYRHPIKSHGRESLNRVTLHAGQSMPYDRVWAIAHEAAKAEPGVWAHCANFSRVSKSPELMAITSQLDEDSGIVSLSHPDLPTLSVNPDTDANALIDWVSQLVPHTRAQPASVMRLDGRGYTDSDFPSVTLCNLASHRAVEVQMEQALSLHRWRGNIWFDSEAPWAEFDWIGRDITIGDCILRPRERTDRCIATTANPDTGQRDADTLAALESFGHQDFSVRCEVIKGGTLQLGNVVQTT
ncbi:MOSC N-terminal beta barrel domain-containing protein [Sulfitobacter sp. TSTF-M16]|uniref:MOSC N-terminal beta barrel domain-containing protein n=1 Tax=Sulfitobacter aestuariivivens TaxID=2766981 RepID=A0A927HFN7_9RHOB|nr:MOSC N-terminal beta barrel domain-containing protein [Sulfitobacter aestuariivivens]MBD3666037.1 MOSC N-terminal beta barrel domain-containing protein [Sulfitobacter aestuariivivens]